MIHFLLLLLIKMTRNTLFQACSAPSQSAVHQKKAIKWLDLAKLGKNAFFPKTSLRTLGGKKLHFLSSLPPTHKKLDV